MKRSFSLFPWLQGQRFFGTAYLSYLKIITIVLLWSCIIPNASSQNILHEHSNHGFIWQKVVKAKSDKKSFKPFQLFLPGTKSSAQSFNSAVEEGVVFDVSHEGAASIIKSSPQQISLIIPASTTGKSFTLELLRVDILSNDFKLTNSAMLEVAEVYKGGIHYHGVVANDPTSLVAISIYKDKVMGLIANSNGNYSLANIEGSEHQHILYRDQNLKMKYNFACSMLEDGIGYKTSELSYDKASQQGCIIENYVEVGKSIYDGFNGNLSNTTDFVTALFNQIFVLYANEMIDMQLSEIYVWTTPDPYTGPTSDDYLSQFKDEIAALNGHLGTLLILDNVGGVAAKISGLCDPDIDNRLCISGLPDLTYENVPVYSFNVNVVAHEIGHLMGSRHTHACVWNGDNTAIDGCAGFVEGNCDLPPNPPGGGTIMSYCDNTSVGTNLSLGFGPQPGNVIRNAVSNASCLGGNCCVPPKITSLDIAQPDCSYPLGSIIVEPIGNGIIEYSIDNGSSWQSSNSFDDLLPGNYQVMIRFTSSPDCVEEYAQNPIILIVPMGNNNQTWYKDTDDDGFTDGTTIISCAMLPGYKLWADLGNPYISDCDDNDANLFPGQTFYKDADGDNYSNGVITTSCLRPPGYKYAAELNGLNDDCNDNNTTIYPSAPEICDNLDNDCDSEIDEGIFGFTYNGDVFFSSQAQIDAWPACYSNINGNVTISGYSINSLAPLANIVQISGNLNIQLTYLTNLNGLNSLASVGGNFNLFYNFVLNDCCAIFDLLNNAGVDGVILIFFNATNCNSLAQIFADCSLPLINDPNSMVNEQLAFSALPQDAKSEFTLYPNPTNNWATVHSSSLFEIGFIHLYDLRGQMIRKWDINSHQLPFKVDLQGIERGVYTVQLTTGGNVAVEKLIIQ